MNIERVPPERPILEEISSLLLLGLDSVPAPINPQDAMADLYTVMTEGMTFVAKSDDGGAIIAVMALEAKPYRFNHEVTILTNAHFFIHPDWRGKGIAEALRREAVEEGEALGAIVLLAEFNAKKAGRYRSVIMGFTPVGIETRIR